MDRFIRLFLVGDVMLGRGVDQILKHSCKPVLHEGYVKDARDYVKLAVAQSGPLPGKSQRQVDYIWGSAMSVLEHMQPDVKIINLETSVTVSDKPWPDKGIHYRMHPGNVDVIKALGADVCVLSNNHVLDWSHPGLLETLQTLNSAGISYAGAGHNISEASAPAITAVPGKGRVLTFGGCHGSSGVPHSWKAQASTAGVNLLDIDKLISSSKEMRRLADEIKSVKEPNDIVVFSIHWGGNWGFAIPQEQQDLAHRLIDEAHVDVVHGHSSHHVKGVEVYKGKLVIYGCGDWLTDYEGISSHESYHGELNLMYFPLVDAQSGRLTELQMVPSALRKLRLNKASESDVKWLWGTMDRECKQFGHEVIREGDVLKLKFETATGVHSGAQRDL